MKREVFIDGIKYVPEQQKSQYISFWYMHDNHTFSRLDGNTLEELAESGYNFGLRSPCGMLCAPSIITHFSDFKKREETIVGKSVFHPFSGNLDEWKDEVNKWTNAIKDNPEALKLIEVGKIN